MSNFDPWGPISSILFELDSDSVQSIIERAGIAPDWSLTKEQAYSHRTRNRAFRGKINKIYHNLYPDDKELFIINVAKGIIGVKSEHRDTISELLQNIGWTLIVDRIFPIEVLNPKDLGNIPQPAHDDLSKAAERLPNDLSGAITNACGAVESICSKIYDKYSLGDIGGTSFQEKVNKSLEAVGALEKIQKELIELGWGENDANILCQNLKGSINQASYVMQKIRSDMGDVHGSKPALSVLAFDSIKWSMIISSLLNE